MKIRPETPDDHADIYRLTETAFEPMPFSQGDEADCIEKLRADGDLTLSLVAIEDDRLVGHVAFSPVAIGEMEPGWFGLGPVAVWPDLQKNGIGGALIREGLDRLRAMGVPGCVLIGDPNYYVRFGFAGDGRISYRDLPTPVVQWLAFSDLKPAGEVTYSPGLE